MDKNCCFNPTCRFVWSLMKKTLLFVAISSLSIKLCAVRQAFHFFVSCFKVPARSVAKVSTVFWRPFLMQANHVFTLCLFLNKIIFKMNVFCIWSHMFALCLSLNIEELVHIYAVEQHCFGPFFFSLSGF